MYQVYCAKPQCRTLCLVPHSAAALSAPSESVHCNRHSCHLDGEWGCKATRNDFSGLQSHQSAVWVWCKVSSVYHQNEIWNFNMSWNRKSEKGGILAFVSPVSAALLEMPSLHLRAPSSWSWRFKTRRWVVMSARNANSDFKLYNLRCLFIYRQWTGRFPHPTPKNLELFPDFATAPVYDKTCRQSLIYDARVWSISRITDGNCRWLKYFTVSEKVCVKVLITCSIFRT